MTRPLETAGRFGGAVIAGPHDGDPKHLASDEPILGLSRDSTYLFASLRDESGHVHSLMRRRAVPPTWPNRLLVRSTRAGAGIDRHDVPQRSAAASQVAVTKHDDSMHFSAESVDGDEPMHCSVGPDEVSWHEGTIARVTGIEVSPGLQWYLPDPDGSMLYVSRLFRVTGRFGDVDVRGIVGVDDVFLDPGCHNYVDDPITKHRLSTAWCTWATCYEDGTAESGHVAFGHDRFAFAVRSASDGEIDIGVAVHGDVEFDDGAPVHASFDIDGTVWEFVIDPRGRCAPLGGPVVQSEGCFRRVGETRRPVVWSASLEVPA